MRAGLWLGVVAGGVALFFYGGTMDARAALAMPLVCAGGVLVLAGLAMLVVVWRSSRATAYVTAAQSPDAIARWQVSSQDMEAFRRLDSARAGRLWSLANSLSFPSNVPPEGFPVIFGERSLVIGDRLYDFGIGHFGTPGEMILLPGQPGFLEIHSFMEVNRRRSHIAVLRVPVPAAARGEAETVLAHFQTTIAPSARAHIHRWFAAHFEAVAQAEDIPHRLQRRRKWLIPALIVFCLAMLAIVLGPRLT
ncbi:MAG TPA: hypothetical protein VLK25_06340 [Allosphingosinicella sp.]|nr:hypothetical protein [Allosphingosinicella sp.]